MASVEGRNTLFSSGRGWVTMWPTFLCYRWPAVELSSQPNLIEKRTGKQGGLELGDGRIGRQGGLEFGSRTSVDQQPIECKAANPLPRIPIAALSK